MKTSIAMAFSCVKWNILMHAGPMNRRWARYIGPYSWSDVVVKSLFLANWKGWFSAVAIIHADLFSCNKLGFAPTSRLIAIAVNNSSPIDVTEYLVPQ